MKKISAFILAAVLAFSSLPLFALANGETEDKFTDAYFVDIAPEFKNKMKIESLSGSYYVKPGEPFSFTIRLINGYRLDRSSKIKYGSTDRQTDILNGEDAFGEEAEYKDGYYTIPAVNEDTYVFATSVNKKSIARVKDTFLAIINEILNFLKQLFPAEAA